MQREGLAICLRNLLKSAWNGIPLERLDAEFDTLFGSRIPLGTHKDLESLLRAMPDVCSVQESGMGRITVFSASINRRLRSAPAASRFNGTLYNNIFDEFPFRGPRQPDVRNIGGNRNQLIQSNAKRGGRKVLRERLNEAVFVERLSGIRATNIEPARLSSFAPNSTGAMVRKSRRTSPPEQRNSTTPFANAYSMLELYFRQNSLPKFELKVVEQRDSFFCTILFEGDTYRSYPDVFTTEIQARDRAAFKLLEKLGAATKQSLQSPEAQPLTRPQLKMDTPEQIDSVVTKLLKMLEKKPTGIFCHAVAQLFAEDFDAELSGDWMKKIEGDRRLEIRSNGMAPVLYKTTAQIRSWTQKSLTIPELSFPPGGADVFVTNIISANHFCGLVDRESRQKMESQLNAFYSQENVSSRLKLQPFEEPVVGTSYATLAVGWCRAQCVEKRSESEAAKFRFIDCGAIREIPNDRIYHLADVFYSFPYFLIDFSLQEFANIDESEAKDPEILAEIRRLILLKPVRVVPTPGCDLSARPLPVRVYSKSDSDSGGNSNQLSSCVDVNSRLYRLFATPAINYPTGCSEAYLTNVSPDGTFFLQIEGFGLQEFRRLTIEPSKDVCVGKVLFDEVYCARLKESWSRCVVTQIASHQEIGIEFIDYGIEDTVSIEEIFPLKLIEHLEDLPPQALRTHLTNVIPYSSWNNGDIGEITQICPLNQKLVVERSKVTHCRKRFCDLNILHVEIFKPIESGNRLVSVNAEVYRKLRKLA